MSHCDPTLEALREQVGCYRRLAKLVEVQHEHVQQGRTDQLLEVLGLRQEVLERVSQHEAVIRPAKQRWTQYLGGLDGTRRAEAETLLAETGRLLEQITTADRNDVLILNQQKLSLGHQINKASAARQVNRTYAAAAYGSRAAGGVDLQR